MLFQPKKKCSLSVDRFRRIGSFFVSSNQMFVNHSPRISVVSGSVVSFVPFSV